MEAKLRAKGLLEQVFGKAQATQDVDEIVKIFDEVDAADDVGLQMMGIQAVSSDSEHQTAEAIVVV